MCFSVFFPSVTCSEIFLTARLVRRFPRPLQPSVTSWHDRLGSSQSTRARRLVLLRTHCSTVLGWVASGLTFSCSFRRVELFFDCSCFLEIHRACFSEALSPCLAPLLAVLYGRRGNSAFFRGWAGLLFALCQSNLQITPPPFATTCTGLRMNR